MKTYRYLSIVALALMGAMMIGCSKSDIDESDQSASNDNIVTLTTTIGFDEGDEATKALTSGGVKTFAAGDQIAVVYVNTSNNTIKTNSSALTSSNISNDGKTAKFTVSLSNPAAGGSVKYIYPSNIVNSDGSINYDKLDFNNSDFPYQDGTLSKLATYLDLAVYEGTMTSKGELPSGVLSNQLAILAITLKDSDGSDEITSSITNLSIWDGTYGSMVYRSAASGPIYVAIRPTNSAKIIVAANDGTTGYNKTLSSKTYEAGKLYKVTWRMTQTELNQVICTDGSIYSSVDDATAANKTAVGLVVCDGLALALSDVTYENNSRMNWENALTAAPAHTPTVSGASWMVPSKAQWTTMFNAAGSSINLRLGFSSVGGTNMQAADYWSGTEYSSSEAWSYYSSSGYWECRSKTNNFCVRACLAF